MTLLYILLVLICILFIILVVLQNPKIGGINNNFNIYGNRIFGIQKNLDFFEKSTWIMSFIIFVIIIIINYLLNLNSY